MIPTTSMVLVNNEFRQVLIYSSETEMEFPNKNTHVVTQEFETAKHVTVYTCENAIYRTIKPTKKNPNWTYWFLIKASQNEVFEIPSEIIAENEQLKQANAILMGLEE